MRAEHQVYQYLRHKKKFPGVWCSGCGIGIVLGSIIRAVDGLEIAKDDIAMISGIGCSGRMSVYVDFNTMHTTHGRALAFATGLKMARPEMHVLVVMGDGDALAIGGNHFIHAARRNIDLTAIVINNNVYGMTGGQYSPTTPEGALATTAPYGSIERPFSACDLAQAAGAAYVARSTVYHARELDRLIEGGMRKKGFAVIEAASYCHTTYGRINKSGSAVQMMQQLKERGITQAAAAKLSAEELEDKIVRGVLVDRDLPEYTAEYAKIIERAQAEQAELERQEQLQTGEAPPEEAEAVATPSSG
jgi:2-oxoglutarate ferredoxin oxidoreductase subunit beta